jgi:PrtD family type I secretion system ABC transporter
MQDELGQIITQFRKAWFAVALLSGATSVLALTGSVFMLAVYDRVIPAGSIPTLVVLGLLCLCAYGLQALVDIVRGQMLTRIGLATKEALSPRIFDISVRQSAAGRSDRGAASRDLDQIQSFLSSTGPAALFDMPWVPFYLAICFLFHFWMGVFATAAVLLLVSLAFVNELLARGSSNELADATAQRSNLLASSQQQAESLEALGMTANLAGAWGATTAETSGLARRLSDTVSTAGSISRVARMVVQSAVLALGAYLVMSGEATGGIMIAGSILSSRALAPIESAIANAKGFLSARQSWSRLRTTLAELPAETTAFSPPVPSRSITAENLALVIGGGNRVTVSNVSFTLEAGDCVAILGAGGAGKSTLAKALVGVLRPVAGSIRLDGTSIGQWRSSQRGRFVGYLPQQVKLFEGTIAQNIARFDPATSSDAIIHAARTAGVHDMISRLPDGYMTRLGPGGVGLSGGQTQRIGLARAVYGDPFLVVLDEPNASTDIEGDAALLRLIARLRARGSITVVITHGSALLAAATHALVLSNGRQRRFGTVEEVLAQERPTPAAKVNHAA